MRKLWTAQENERIRNLRKLGMTYKEMVPHFPDRNLRTISVQANKLLDSSRAINPWTEEEEDYLVELRQNNVPYKEIAEILDRSYSSVKTKGSYLIADSTKSRPSEKKSFERRKEEVLSDLTDLEIDYIENGQEFFRF